MRPANCVSVHAPPDTVRPGWFDAGTGTEQHVELRRGDLTEYGMVRRTHVADTLGHAFLVPSAAARTVEVFSVDGPAVTDWAAAFDATDPDRPRARERRLLGRR